MSALLDRILGKMDELGITAYRISNDIGLSNSAFSDWKKGKGSPSLDAVTKIASYMNVSIDYLVNGSDFVQQDQPDPAISIPVELSGRMDEELLDKFHRLTPDLQEKLMAYLDGMLAAAPKPQDDEKRLSV